MEMSIFGFYSNLVSVEQLIEQVWQPIKILVSNDRNMFFFPKKCNIWKPVVNKYVTLIKLLL